MIASIATAVSDEAAGLTTIPADQREAINAGAEKLHELANNECDVGGGGGGETTSTTKEKTDTSTTDTTTSTTETTTTTPEPPTVPEQPPQEGGGLGHGNEGGTPPDTGSGGTQGG